MTLFTKIIIVVVILSAVLFRMILGQEWILATGEEIVLKLEPRDPRSLFRGDYMRLNYEINTLAGDLNSGEGTLADNQVIYVSGQVLGGFWTPKQFSTAKPTSDELFLKGRISSMRFERETCDTEERDCEPSLESVTVRYGLDTFFIPEGTGLALEERVAEVGFDRVKVLVRVSSGGDGILESFLIDGEPVYQNQLF